MRNTRATSRYAKSLLELAKEQNTLQPCKTDMVSVVSSAKTQRVSFVIEKPRGQNR